MLSDVAQVDEDVRSELPSEIDVSAVLTVAGFPVIRAEKTCSYGRRLVEVCKNNEVVMDGLVMTWEL